DLETYLFIEKGIRGGMVNAIKRYATANDRHLSNYNQNIPSNYLMYLDANNLYAMIQKLPFDELQFVDHEIKTYQDLNQFIKNLNREVKGCILEVDRNLLQALERGLELTAVHRVLTFKESNWMEKCIVLNTKLRTQAKNEFEKYFFKLMNNSV